jgi:transcriptional regulator with XRE-family HTH domain
MLRVKRQLSQLYVAEKSGYSQRYYLRVERGTQNPTYKFMLSVAPVLGLRPSQLLSLAERKHRQFLQKRAAGQFPLKTKKS